ncbi:MAG: hypothetical protein HY298_02275 [Verrucomicrobia bacterium]|nr:hypothetical protein [Verrucomicrobiota bacterium]
MTTVTETIQTQSGVTLVVDKRLGEHDLEILLRLEPAKKCILHWGLRAPDKAVWEIPPDWLWPEGTIPQGKTAVQTPFRRNGENQIVIRLQNPPAFSSIVFALFFPEPRRWDNNHGQNYRIEIAREERSHSALQRDFQQEIYNRNVLFEQTFNVQSEGQLAAAVIGEPECYSIVLFCDVPGPLVFHWGFARYSSYDWFVPPASLRPPGTVLWQNTPQTPFAFGDDGLSRLHLEFPIAEAPLGIQFVLKQVATNRWLKERGGNFYLPVTTTAPKQTGLETAELHPLVDEIVQAEMGRGSWTLMHRFNLCHDLLDRVGNNPDGLALLFVWLRFSATRQLTWQRNYNTKPRELSHAQERLTQKLADMYTQVTTSRPLVRLILATVGRGGEGQRIRDEILNIMHRHHIKEVSGHFTEEWHQKLHNNTTPDDIVICEAYLEFLRSSGNLERFYQRLQEGGVTKARLESFERPITTPPDFVPHLKEALIHDFENFLKVLKSVHAGADLETAIHSAQYQLDADTQSMLSDLWARGDDPHLPLMKQADQITEIRCRLQLHLSTQSAREILYLDLALEQFLRGLVERNIHQHLSNDQLVDLIQQVVENLLLSQPEAELDFCLRHWKRLSGLPRFGQDWSLHAKAVLDRIGRVLSSLIDRTYQLLQPKAELLGNAFHAEAWTITLFSEEVVRGASLGFTLSLLLHHLDPRLRQAAQLGDWQIISPGGGQGMVEIVDALRSVQGKSFDGPRVIVADHVMGDEEIPESVSAVIAPDVTDIVSHVAVRARNAHLLFATCYDAATLARLKALRGHHIQVKVTPAGDVVFEKIAGEALARPAVARATRQAAIKPQLKRFVVTSKEFDETIVGAKSVNLKRLREKVPDWIRVPDSMALPFGVFEEMLRRKENATLAGNFHRLVKQLDREASRTSTLEEIRAVISTLNAPAECAATLRLALQKAHWPSPLSWEDAWQRIKRVWASKWNERAYLSRRTRGIAHEDLFMAVLIQPVVEAEYAFVIHTANPFTGKWDELFAEVVLGLGETLVGNYSGRALSFTFDKQSNRQCLLSYPGKSVGLYGSGLIFRSDSSAEDLADYAAAGLYDSVLLQPPREVALDYSREPLIWDESFRRSLVADIARIGVEVETAFGVPQDIEGAYAKGQFWVVQTRPQVGLDHA